jgi:hypothetical protein
MEHQNFSHAEVFSDLKTLFSAQEAAEYLELDSSQLADLISNGYLGAAEGEGAASLFSTDALRACKRRLRAETAPDA